MEKPKNKMEVKKALKMHHFNEMHSKVTIENMFYKDSAPAITLILYKQSSFVENTCEYFKEFYDSSNDVYIFSKKAFKFVFVHCNNIDKIIDMAKVADLIVFDVTINEKDEYKDKLDMYVFETIAVINAHGQTKILFVSESENKKIKRQFEKRLKAECGYLIRIFNLHTMKLNLSKFKIRPVEFKCTNAYVYLDKVEDGKVIGQLRGKPIGLGVKEIFVEDRFVGVESIKVVKQGLSFSLDEKKKKNEEEENVEEELDEIKDNALEFEENQEDCEESNDTKELSDNEEESNNSINNLNTSNNSIVESEDIAATHETTNTAVEGIENKTTNFLMKNKAKDKKAWEEKNKILRKQNYALPGDIIEVFLSFNDNCKEGSVMVFNLSKIELDQNVFYSGNTTLNKYFNNNMNALNKIIGESELWLSTGWNKYKLDGTNYKLSKGDLICDKMNKNGVIFNFHMQNMPGLEKQNFVLFTKENVFFRILASGKFTEKQSLYRSYNLMGYPNKVNVNTVHVKGMFNSRKECTKFLLANLKTASGIRGMLKTPIGAGGDFRATFEGNILESDVVLLQVKEKYDINSLKEEVYEDESVETSEDASEEEIKVKQGYLQKLKKQCFVKKELDSCEEFEKMLNSDGYYKDEIESVEESNLEVEKINSKGKQKDAKKEKIDKEERRRVNAIKNIKQTKRKHRNKKRRGKNS